MSACCIVWLFVWKYPLVFFTTFTKSERYAAIAGALTVRSPRERNSEMHSHVPEGIVIQWSDLQLPGCVVRRRFAKLSSAAYSGRNIAGNQQ